MVRVSTRPRYLSKYFTHKISNLANHFTTSLELLSYLALLPPSQLPTNYLKTKFFLSIKKMNELFKPTLYRGMFFKLPHPVLQGSFPTARLESVIQGN